MTVDVHDDAMTGTSEVVGLEGARSSRDVALDLLVEVVGEQSRAGRVLTGSEVRIALKHRTYGGFDVKALGFRRFRDFLDEAAREGRIDVDTARMGDVGVWLPGMADAGGAPQAAIRGDLWKAFVDWGPDELRLYDIQDDKVLRLPREAAPLEPEEFTRIRREAVAEPKRFAPINAIHPKQQLDWMHEFAAGQDAELRELLSQALSGSKPHKVFGQVLRALPEVKSRWDEALLGHVRVRVEDWRNQRSLSVSIDKRTPSPDAKQDEVTVGLAASLKKTGERHEVPTWILSQNVASPSAEETFRALTAIVRTNRDRPPGRSQHAPGTPGTNKGESDLRSRLHAAINRMPVEELRRLSIPVGYLFED